MIRHVVVRGALRALLPGIALVLAAPRGASAQRLSATLDAGAAAVRYADSLDVSAATLSPAFDFITSSTTLSGAGTFAQGGSGVWSLQGQLAASAFTPSLGSMRAELAGSVGGSAHEDGTRTGELLARARLHFMKRAWGVWAGGGGGRTWDGDVWRNMLVGEAGAWARAGTSTIVLGTEPAVVDDTIRYTDTQLSARWASTRLELGGVVGARAGHGLPTVAGSRRAWGSISATFWLGEHLGLVAGGGSYPVDFTQGYPGGRFVQVGIRMAVGRMKNSASAAGARGRAGEMDRDSRIGGASGTKLVSAFDTRPGAGDQVTLRVRAPAAHTVDISGDFTSWEAVRLERGADGWWTVTLPIESGTHQLNVRIDGAAWLVPPGLMAITDESGSSGLLSISR